MLSTEELREYVETEIQSQLGNISNINVFFAEGMDSSIEGTYIFNKNNQYHILFAEKGKIRSHVVTLDKREVLWNALEVFATNIIMDYAIKHSEKGKDFRRAYFIKEKEIFSKFGKDFEERKNNEIEQIINRNPYKDI